MSNLSENHDLCGADGKQIERDLAAIKEDQAKLARDEAVVAHDRRELEKDIAKLEHDLERPQKHQFEVIVIYNGLRKEFEVRFEELIQRLLEQARQAFGPITNPHLLGLFNEAGAELKDDQTIKAAGVKPHDKLLLRPSSVRGGR